MSVAFIKEPNEDQVEVLPDRDLGTDTNFVTPRGLDLIAEAIATLNDRLDVARSAGDKVALATIHRDLRYWKARHSTAELIEPAGIAPETVQFGTRVAIKRDDGRSQTYAIVGIDEADPASGYLSYASPLARSLIGKGRGEMARAGAGQAEIVEIMPG